MKILKTWKNGSPWAGAILLGALAALPLHAQNYPSLIQAQSPLDYWRFSEPVSSPPLDIASNYGSTGAAGNGYVLDGAVQGQPGIVGNCITLTNTGEVIGDCYTRVDIPNLPALNPNPPFTVEFWMKPNAPFNTTDTTGLCALSSDSPDPGQTSRSGYLFYALPQSITFRLGGEGGYTATAIANLPVSTANWTHVVGEFDGTTASIFVNGAFAGSGTASPSSPFYANQWVPTRVGGTSLDGDAYVDVNDYIWLFTGNRGFDGGMDEVAVYNTLLSSNTIKSHYTTATNNPGAYDALVLASSPVGYWNFDEPAYTPPMPSYTLTTDIGSLGDNGTNTLGSLADQPGVPGLSSGDKSVFYSGEAGSLELSSNEAPQEIGGQTVTLAAWIKPTTLGVGYAGSIIVQGYDPTQGYEENYLRIADTYDWEGNGDPDVAYYDVGTYNGGAQYNSAIYPVPPGDIGHWVFLVGTYDGAFWNLYRNGVLLAQFEDDGSGPAALSDQWSVGSRSGPNPYFGFFFPGSIAEPAIFTNALDAVTISNLYNSVALPPVLTQPPVAPEPSYLGSSATFSVWADGPGTLTYQWESNNVAVAGQTGTNFTLTGLTAAANATYSVVVTSQYGSVTGSTVLIVTPTLPPVTVVPVAETRWLGSPLSFGPANLPNQQLTYQWDLNGHAIGGATSSNYTATTSAGTVGSYTLVISNNFGSSTSSVATLKGLTIPTISPYPGTILADQPLSYFRLDETNGTIAYDYAGGNNGNYYGSVELGQPGYSLIDPDFAVTFPGLANSYVGDIGATTINFSGTPQFSIEAWANGAAGQISGAAVIAKGTGNVGANYASEQFAISVVNGVYSFFVRDKKGNIAQANATTGPTTGPDGAWHYLVGVCNGSSLTFYIDGTQAGYASSLPSDGILESEDGVSIGAERSGVLPTYDWAYNGTIDEVAIYSYALSSSQVQAHYAAAYGPNQAPFISIQPVSVTNYYNLPVTLSVEGAGTVPLTYQWNMVGSGPVAGATSATYTIPNLAYSDAGTYTVGLTNSVGGILSIPVIVTVLAPPTDPPSIPDLVVHITFDGNLLDVTGRGNNATNENSGGAPLLTNDYEPGVIGQAFTYQTSVSTSSTTTNVSANYASLGVRPDLQFGSNVSFTVSMWVLEPEYYAGNDLPFFTDAVGSTYGKGYVFAPSYGTTVGSTPGWVGAWAYSVFDNPQASGGNGVGVYGDVGSIDDGNWHNLVYVMDRLKGGRVYLDGLLAHSTNDGGTTLIAAGDIDTTNAATIGQDPTGLYTGLPGSIAGTFAIDDLGVWRRALTPLEAASIYSAGAGNANGVSFTGAPLTFTHQVLKGPQLVLTWNEGDLQSSTSLNGPWTTLTGVTSPYTNSPTGASTFFRVKF